MIIDCICGLKKFEVDGNQIPSEGRQVKCGVCSKEWFYKPDNISQTDQMQDQDNENITIPKPKDTPVPNDVEETVSQAEQNEKIKLDFSDLEDEMPSKAEMDENLEKIKAERKKNKKSSSKGSRTRMLFYLLIILILVLGVVSIPYKDTVLAIFPELEIVFSGLEPVYQLLFK